MTRQMAFTMLKRSVIAAGIRKNVSRTPSAQLRHPLD